MTKRIFANRFGLIALMSVSLFASTAALAATQPVLVTTPTAQPVPVVEIIKDSDAPARKPYQTGQLYFTTQIGTNFKSLMTIPANQRLVIQHVSGLCWGVNTIS